MRPLLFLDIDDVLCLSDPYGGFDVITAANGRHANPAAVYRELFVPRAMSALRQVHDAMTGDLRYVISSTWREVLDRSQLEDVFRQSGLGFVADNLVDGEAWQTPAKFARSRRVDEISAWLDRHHQGEPFVILDDTHSGASLSPAVAGPMYVPSHPFAGRVVLCEENVGLTREHIAFIVDALRRGVVAPGVCA